jgi:hypothetical protein
MNRKGEIFLDFNQVVSSPTNITAFKDFARVELFKRQKDAEDLER